MTTKKRVTVSIPTTAKVRRFNAAVERADELTGGRFDRCPVEHLAHIMDCHSWYTEARELREAEAALNDGK